jgi:beta-glucosidase
VTSVKHYAAYGQPEGGRDYNTTDMSPQRLRNLYLPPFKAAIDAGADTAMCSFNAINGVGGCGNRALETNVLKRQWGFDGFIESDYTAVAELRACPPVMPDEGPCGHGNAADGPSAAALALNSGTDMEMVSTNIRDFGKRLLADGRISRARLDDAVRRILRVKFRAGLFEHPYVDPAKAEAAQLKPDAVAAARKAAGRSMVLLKNAGGILPLDPSKKTAVIGPLAKNGHDMLGPWWGQGKDEDAVTVFDGIDAQSSGATTYAQGCSIADKEPPNNTPADECGSSAGFGQAVEVANAADQVVLALGESRGESGEAASRSEIDLPGMQEELIARIKATGKPFVDVLFGKVNPGGKLPVSFPRRVGQVPIYYNHEPTGRPCDVGSKYNSRYRDIASCDPQYVFGYGLSYTTFDVSNLRLSSRRVSKHGKLTASVDVTNTGARKGDEVVQLYLHDPVASISQPVRRLRGFERVTLAPKEERTVSFTLNAGDFGFYDNRGRFVVERGLIDVYAGDSSRADLKESFTVR